MTKTALIVVADLHVGSTVAVCPPRTNLDDGGTYEASRGQAWLWRCWQDFHKQAESETAGCRRILVVNGDALEYDAKARSHQVITRNKATIQSITAQVLEPALSYVDGCIIVRGTEAHTGKSATGEEELANDITNIIPDTERGTASWWQVRSTVEGVRVDIAHHARMSNIPWAEKSAALKLVTIARTRYLEQGQTPPDVFIRAHVHRYSDSGANYATFGLTLPCWTLASSYTYTIGAENCLADVGGVVIKCEDGKYDFKKQVYAPRRVALWKTMI